jgi:hypothetical protein
MHTDTPMHRQIFVENMEDGVLVRVGSRLKKQTGLERLGRNPEHVPPKKIQVLRQSRILLKQVKSSTAGVNMFVEPPLKIPRLL